MKRATFTEAEVVRLGRAAEKLGKTLVVMRDGGFVFADPDKVALPSPPSGDPFDLVDYSK
jgi:hypothetical protein